MTRTPFPLAEDLADRPFTTREGRSLGLSVRSLRSSDWYAEYGLRAPLSAPDLAARVAELALVLPERSAFSHLTAARVWGLPTPTAWQGRCELVDVMVPTLAPAIRRASCRGHRGLERRWVSELDDIKVIDPLDTWADLATWWSLGDLVAAADHLLSEENGIESKHLERAAADRYASKGVRRLRRAAELARVGSASPWESKARVILVEHGLPEPELNVTLFDDDGEFLGCGDLVWREQRVVAEYDGDQHRTQRARWQYERERRARLEDAGWTYVEMTSLSLTSSVHRRALLTRLHRALGPS